MSFHSFSLQLVIFGSTIINHAVGLSPIIDECNQYYGCSDCSLQANCAWNEYNDICETYVDESFGFSYIIEEAGCPDFNPIASTSLNEGEALHYTLNFKTCTQTYNQDEITLDELKQMSMDISDNNQPGCENETTNTTFWVIESSDQTLSYRLFGKVDILNDDGENIDNIPPCDIFIQHGAMTSITCPLHNLTNGRDMEINRDAQADTLYAILKIILPRTSVKLFDEQHDILEQDVKGDLLKVRTFEDNENTDYASIEKV